MFQSVPSCTGRNLLVILIGLSWLGAATTNSFSADAKAQAHLQNEGHPPAAGVPVAGLPAPEGHDAPAGPIDWSTDLALWSLIVFVLFVTVLRTFAWGPLSGALSAREHKIKSDIAHAEEARIKAERMLNEYQAKLAAAQDEVLKTLAEARRDAEHTRQEIMAQTEKDVAATKERAILEIERTKDKALEELFNHMAGAVANATEHVLGRALTDADQDRLIGDALAEFSRGQAS